jgi:acyl-CoA hydrolase
VQIRAEPLEGGAPHPVAEAYVTMVAVGPNNDPIPVPRLTLTTDEERRRFEEGRQRTELRRRARSRAVEKEEHHAV